MRGLSLVPLTVSSYQGFQVVCICVVGIAVGPSESSSSSISQLLQGYVLAKVGTRRARVVVVGVGRLWIELVQIQVQVRVGIRDQRGRRGRVAVPM